MAKKVFPRPQRLHERSANEIIAQYEREHGGAVSMPVPVELIIEKTIGLSILYDEIPEQPGEKILGAIAPSERWIVLNIKHQGLFDEYLGPERFTLAHELGHWIYDADRHPEGQQTLGLDAAAAPEVFCYHRESGRLSDAAKLREVNANKFAGCLLMPDYLMSEQDIDLIMSDLTAAARRFEVSRRALEIRLDTLDLVDDEDRLRFNL